jgi:hypothetical protein
MQVLFILLSAATFIFYGVLCLSTDHMKKEFERYGMSRFRRLTGVLELLGGVGLIVGLQFKIILIISSAGLGLLMLLGSLTRIRVKDPFIELLPALLLMVINFWILYGTIY